MSDAQRPRQPSRLLALLPGSLGVAAFLVYLLTRRSGGLAGFVDFASDPWALWLVLGLAFAAKATRKWHGSLTQHYLDALAASVVMSPKSAPFWLYLRPFTLDGSMPEGRPYQGLLEIFSLDSGVRDFEELLRQAIQGNGRACLVALGRQDGYQGAGRATVPDTEWRKSFEALSAHARRIVVIPAGGSVSWEVESLMSQGLLEKVVFLMPALSRSKMRFSLSGPYERDRGAQFWSEATREMDELGLAMPDYRKGGMVFTLTSDGAQNRLGALKSLKPRVLRRALRWAADDPLV